MKSLIDLLVNEYGFDPDQASSAASRVIDGTAPPVSENPDKFDFRGTSKNKDESGVAPKIRTKDDIGAILARGFELNDTDLQGYGPYDILDAFGRAPRHAKDQAQYKNINDTLTKVEDKRWAGLPPNTLPADLVPNEDYFPEGALMGAQGYAAPRNLTDAVEPDYGTGPAKRPFTGVIPEDWTKQIEAIDPLKQVGLMEGVAKTMGTARNRQLAADANARYPAQPPVTDVDVGPIQATPKRMPVSAMPRYDLDIGHAQESVKDVEVGPITQAPPANNLEFLKRLRQEHEEKISAIKMLQEYVHAQDATHTNDVVKGQLWSMLTPPPSGAR